MDPITLGLVALGLFLVVRPRAAQPSTPVTGLIQRRPTSGALRPGAREIQTSIVGPNWIDNFVPNPAQDPVAAGSWFVSDLQVTASSAWDMRPQTEVTAATEQFLGDVASAGTGAATTVANAAGDVGRQADHDVAASIATTSNSLFH